MRGLPDHFEFAHTSLLEWEMTNDDRSYEVQHCWNACLKPEMDETGLYNDPPHAGLVRLLIQYNLPKDFKHRITRSHNLASRSAKARYRMTGS